MKELIRIMAVALAGAALMASCDTGIESSMPADVTAESTGSVSTETSASDPFDGAEGGSHSVSGLSEFGHGYEGIEGTGDFNYGEALQKSVLFFELQRSCHTALIRLSV